MEQTIPDSRSLRNAVRLGLTSRLCIEADGFEVPVIEIEQFRVRNGGASMLERIRKSRTIERIEVGQESDEFARQRARIRIGRVRGNGGLGHRSDVAHGAVERNNSRKKYQQDDYQDDMLYPPEHPRYRWHVTPPLKTRQDFSTRTMVATPVEYVKRPQHGVTMDRRAHAGMARADSDVRDAAANRRIRKRMRESEDGARCQYN